jgi:hypothetical protein
VVNPALVPGMAIVFSVDKFMSEVPGAHQHHRQRRRHRGRVVVGRRTRPREDALVRADRADDRDQAGLDEIDVGERRAWGFKNLTCLDGDLFQVAQCREIGGRQGTQKAVAMRGPHASLTFLREQEHELRPLIVECWFAF